MSTGDYFSSREYPVPSDEGARLRSVLELEFLTDPSFEREQRAVLDGLCEIARQLLGADRALVGLVFEHEERFAGTANLEGDRTQRSEAFCAHTVAQNRPLVVRNALVDPRFAAYAAVTGPMHLRFYAGVPLAHGGQPVGTFCVVGSEPRDLSDAELDQLDGLARVANAHIELLAERHKLRQQATLLRQSEEIGQMGGWTCDVEQRQILWSEQLYALHEVQQGHPIAYEDFDALYPDGGGDRLLAAIERAVATRRGFELELAYVTANGHRRRAQIIAQLEARTGHAPRVLGVFRDVTEHRRLEAKWEQAALYDAVTGLPNELRLRSRLEEIRQHRVRGALVIVSLDDFQAYRNAAGFSRADALLRALGVRLITEVGPDALVARLGADDLALVLPEQEAGDAGIPQADELRGVVHAFLEEAALTPSVAARLGVAVFPDDADDADEILRAAAMSARTATKGVDSSIAYFAPALRERLEERQTRLTMLRAAVEKDRLTVLFQPLSDVAGRAHGFEARIAIAGADDAPSLAASLEETSSDPRLSATIGERLLEGALAQAERWTLEGVAFGQITVRLSPAVWQRDDFGSYVKTLLEIHGVPGTQLVLSLADGRLLATEHARVAPALEALRRVGVGLALADFGNGFASIGQLKDLSIQRISIQPRVVATVARDRSDRAIAQAVLAVGKALDLGVVAEGVQTADQLTALSALGCQLFQGDYFGCPLLPGEAAAICAGTTSPPSLHEPTTARV